MDLFRFLRPSPPQLGLESRLAAILERLSTIELRFNGMRQEWEIVTSHLDQLTTKVHRELGHITKRKADVERADPCLDEATAHKSRFRGGRSR